MILDVQSLLSDSQAITVTANSTNVLDFGAVGTPVNGIAALPRDIGAGEPVNMVIQVDTTFATLTSLTVALQVSDAEAFGSGVDTLWTSAAIAAADLVAGYKFPPQYIPLGAAKRYMRLVYTVAGSAATAGTVVAGLVLGHQTN